MNDNVKEWTEKSGSSTTAGRARTPKQYKQMIKAEKEEICIFCHLDRLGELIQEAEYWIVKPNDYPYKNHQLHLVIIWHPKRDHLEDIQAIPLEAWIELNDLVGWIIEKYSLPALNFIMRFGDPDLRSSTIHHIHGHIQIPSLEALPQEPPKPLTLEGIEERSIYSGNHCLAFKKEIPSQKQFIVMPLDSMGEMTLFYLIKATLEVIKEQDIQGGGIVSRWGNRRYTNSPYEFPFVKIYAPDGTGRVHATFVPARPGEKKPLCKATFNKGFEGQELEKLQRRMDEFTKEF